MSPQVSPREHDEATAALHEELARLGAKWKMTRDAMHRMAGDRKTWTGNRKHWRMTETEVHSILRTQAATGDVRNLTVNRTPSQALAEDRGIEHEIDVTHGKITALEAIYRQAPWPRYFPCLSAGGHIHSSLRCSTCRWDTLMGWTPQLSGKTEAEAVAELGPVLCSVCFPSAPVEWRQDPSELSKTAQAAEKAAREEARYVKQLRPEERFRGRDGWVETVAACKAILRHEVELRDYYGRGEHPWHAETARDAEAATRVLLARGVTQAEIDKIIANAVKRAIRDGARLNLDGSVKA